MKINKIVLINDAGDQMECDYDIESLNKRFRAHNIEYKEIVCTDLVNGFTQEADLYVIDQGGMGGGFAIDYIFRYIEDKVRENPSKIFLFFTTIWYLPHVWEVIREKFDNDIKNLFCADEQGMIDLVKYLKEIQNV